MSYTVYLDSDFNPVSKQDATLIKIVDAAGRVSFYHPHKADDANSDAAPTANTQKADVHAWHTVIADDPTAPLDAQDSKIMFQGLIAKWQAILKLEDWDITFTVKDLRRVDQGVVVSFSEKKAAIDLSSRNTVQTAEEDVLHELLHLVIFNENWDYDAFCDDMVTRKAITADEYVALQERFNLAQNISIEHIKRIFVSAGLGAEGTPHTQKAMLATAAPWERLAPLTDSEMDELAQVKPGELDVLDELKPFLDAEGK